MSAKHRLARLQLRQAGRERFADPDEPALHQTSLWRMLVKAIRNHKTRQPAGTAR